MKYVDVEADLRDVVVLRRSGELVVLDEQVSLQPIGPCLVPHGRLCETHRGKAQSVSDDVKERPG